MHFVVTLNWKFVVACGAAVSGIILASKLEPDAVERVSIHVIDAYKEVKVAESGNQ